jgi:hypothetical protein
MIETKDRKTFFTHEKNFPQLIEFSKTFNAEISKVQIPSEAEVLELEELAPALCEKKSQKVDYKILELKLCPKITRRKILSRAKKIQTYIHGKLVLGHTVTLKELTKKFKGLTSACLCTHFKLTREKMELEGHLFVKIGGGEYKLTKLNNA